MYERMEKELRTADKDKRSKKTVQRKPSVNCTGIPTRLKEEMEWKTGLSFDDVHVHYNSGRPSQIDALAYTQGNQVYLGPGQEKHLRHELGHVVQQKRGMVRPDTRHPSGLMLNTDEKLERQADNILAFGSGGEKRADNDGVAQRYECQKAGGRVDGRRIYDFEDYAEFYDELEDGGLKAIGTEHAAWKEITDNIYSYYGWPDLRESNVFWAFVGKEGYRKVKFSVKTTDDDVGRYHQQHGSEQTWTVIPSYSTGDQFALAAKMMHDRSANVLILEFGETMDVPHKNGMWELFKRSLATEENPEAVTEDIMGENQWIMQEDVVRVLYRRGTNHALGRLNVEKPGDATNYVGAHYDESWRDNLRKSWLPKETEDAVYERKLRDWLGFGTSIYLTFFRPAGTIKLMLRLSGCGTAAAEAERIWNLTPVFRLQSG